MRSATYLWVSDSAFVNWRLDNNDRIDLIADKKQYAPGETANILVPAPFANAEALLTIERGSIREVRRLFLTGNSERVQIPIRPDYAPNVYVSILMVKGRGPDSPLPQFKLGYVNLSVSTQEKQLSVKLTPDRAAYSPGDKANFSLEASDYTGKPVEAEFSLALVDKAVQSLADSHSLSPLQAFYGERSLSIVTAVSWSSAVERLNQTLRPEAKGGGGGAQDGSVRRDFKDTAYWNPSVVTDKAGQAQVTVTLPDNLTTWNMAAKGVTSGTLVGQASADILSSKDLLVRPVIPRFFVVGDRARLEAVVNNNTGQAIAADVRLDAQGLTVAGNAQQSVNIPAHDKAKVGWDVTVAAVDQVVLKFSAGGGGRQDALEQTLPVRRATSPETVATAGQVETKIAEQIQVPAAADTSAGELRIALSPSLAAASNDSLRYLESYAYESSEQTASKLLPNVATYQALRKLGIERPDLKQSLEVNATRQVQRLYALQNQDGGWGWWGGETSRPVLTAYALLALYTAQQGGFAVDPGVLSRAEQFLNDYLNQPVDAGASYVYNERAFAVFVLTEIGSAGMSSRAVNLVDQRASLDIYAKAYLLMALDKLDLPQAKTILAEIGSAAIASATGSHWEEKQTDYWGMNTNTRTTALVIMALARADSKNANLASAVRWLMTARKGDHWQTTQETAWSVLALTEFMVTTGELQASYTYEVTINGKPLGSGAVDKNNVDQTQEMSATIKDLLQTRGNELAISRSPGSGQLYYSAYLNYYLPADAIAPLNRGIVLGRQYFAVDVATLQPTDRLIESAAVGDYVQVKLTLVAPADLHYLILEDALPAGFEAVDTTLKTSSAAATSPKMLKEPSQKSQSVVARGWFSPYWQYWTHSEIRDDRVVLFATSLGRGVYEYTYIMRAGLAGQFRTLPAQAWETYFPEVFGRSDGALFTVQ